MNPNVDQTQIERVVDRLLLSEARRAAEESWEVELETEEATYYLQGVARVRPARPAGPWGPRGADPPEGMEIDIDWATVRGTVVTDEDEHRLRAEEIDFVSLEYDDEVRALIADQLG
jgi:hypothetical protein